MSLLSLYGYAVLDEYSLPPIMVVSGMPINQMYWLLLKGQMHTKKARKWAAACIILGQPFA